MEIGEEFLSPAFITVIGASASSQRVTLEVATQENNVAGKYQVDLIARYSGSENFCSVTLEIEATHFVFRKKQTLPPKFNETEAESRNINDLNHKVSRIAVETEV